MKIIKRFRIAVSFLLVAILGACANVNQIDRGRLAKRHMQLEPMPHQEAFLNEVHATREGAAGGTDLSAGGGCGCN